MTFVTLVAMLARLAERAPLLQEQTVRDTVSWYTDFGGGLELGGMQLTLDPGAPGEPPPVVACFDPRIPREASEALVRQEGVRVIHAETLPPGPEHLRRSRKQ